MKKNLLVIFTMAIVMTMCLSVLSANAETTLTLDKETYTVGEDVTITFVNATGDANAWIAISAAGVVYEAAGNTNKVWCYANSGTETAGADVVTEGSVTLATVTELVSLPAGDYKVTYFPDISYGVGVEKTFTISEASNPTTGDAFSVFAIIAIISMVAVVIVKRKSVVA